MKNGVGFIVMDEFSEFGVNAVIVDNGHRLSVMFDYRLYAPKTEQPRTFGDFKATVDNGNHLENAKKGEKLSLTLKSTESDMERGNIEIAINTTTCSGSNLNDVYDALNRIISKWLLDYWKK